MVLLERNSTEYITVPNESCITEESSSPDVVYSNTRLLSNNQKSTANSQRYLTVNQSGRLIKQTNQLCHLLSNSKPWKKKPNVYHECGCTVTIKAIIGESNKRKCGPKADACYTTHLLYQFVMAVCVCVRMRNIFQEELKNTCGFRLCQHCLLEAQR